MTRIRRRLVAIFVVATAVPLLLTLWAANSLIDRSLGYSSTLELDQLSRTLEQTARIYYLSQRQALTEAICCQARSAQNLHPYLSRRLVI